MNTKDEGEKGGIKSRGFEGLRGSRSSFRGDLKGRSEGV